MRVWSFINDTRVERGGGGGGGGGVETRNIEDFLGPGNGITALVRHCTH